jgi:hypothetical protein
MSESSLVKKFSEFVGQQCTMYKVKINEGDSMVGVGERVIGTFCLVPFEDSVRAHVVNHKEFILTSPIQSARVFTPESIRFETRTSTYMVKIGAHRE